MLNWLLVAARRSVVPLAALVLLAQVSLADGGYSIIQKIPIVGQGSFDYLTVDEAARRLYVSHGTQVEVLDIDSLSVVGNIPKTLGVHGVAVAPKFGRGFVSNGQAATVTIFDLKTLKPIADVPTGQKPDAIIYEPATSRVFAFNGGSNTATAIDAASGQPVGTVELGAAPNLPLRTVKALSTTTSKRKARCSRSIPAISKSSNAGPPLLVNLRAVWPWTRRIGDCSSAAAARLWP
ncbi:MAG TPA: YncE family protein [Terriglobales bacterium]|nr:YncE family protein [Terriglobales bacterium]